MATKKQDETVTIRAVRNNRKSILIEWLQGADEYSVTFHDNPLPSFLKAIDGLTPHVLTLCEFPAGDAKKIVSTGITVRQKGGENEEALIVAKKRVRKGKRVLNIATPLLPMYPDAEEKTADHMSEDEAAAIEKVIKEAKRYLAGERAQGQIVFEPDPADKKDEGAKTAEFTVLGEPPGAGG